jgi:predicted O-methyltransferase YrrM
MTVRIRINKLAILLLGRLDRIILPINFSKRVIRFLAIESYLDLWLVRPMNGQRNRLRVSYYLASILKPTHAIETGTYLGTTTQYLSSMVSEKTFSIEINKKSLEISKKRLKNEIVSGSIELILGNSKIEMEKVLKTLDPNKHRILVYLDAHWLDYVPLKAEIQSLLDWNGLFIAIIDDFMIPTDVGYGFDQYKNDRIDISQIPISEKISIWIPSESAFSESGARRGTAYLIHNKLSAQVFNNITELKIKPYN